MVTIMRNRLINISAHSRTRRLILMEKPNTSEERNDKDGRKCISENTFSLCDEAYISSQENTI